MPTALADTGPTRTPLPDHNQETKLVTCCLDLRPGGTRQHRTPAGGAPSGQVWPALSRTPSHQLKAQTKEPPVGVPLGKS